MARHCYLVNYAELVNPVTVNQKTVEFVQEAEHVGIVRSSLGNLANILQRISAHKKALAAVSSAGLTRGQRGNPAASLRVHQMYATPVLMSGLPSLVLNKKEIRILKMHYKNTLQNLQRLHINTLRSVVYFLAGTTPFEAVLHSRQLSLFLMICHLPSNPLNIHRKYILSSDLPSSCSWFMQIQELCKMYQLPPALNLLSCPPPKKTFKK